MKDNTDRMDKAIKEKLNGHEVHVPSTLWKSIESKLPPEKNSKVGSSFFKNPFTISFLVVSVVIAGIYLFRSVNKQQTATASVATSPASSHTSIAEHADKHSNGNTYTSSAEFNNINNNPQPTTSTAEHTNDQQQTLPATDNKQSGSQISFFNNSASTTTYAAVTTNKRASSENNKHTTRVNNTGVETKNLTTNQRTTTAYNHTGTIDGSVKNSDDTNLEDASTDKLNSSASGTVSTTATSKKTNSNTATDNDASNKTPVTKTSEHTSADSETDQKNNQAIDASAATVTSENTATGINDVTAQGAQGQTETSNTDSKSNAENIHSNNTSNTNHTGATVGGIASATENSTKTEEPGTQHTNEANTTQTTQTKNNQQGSADDLADVRAYFADSMQVPDSGPSITSSAANTTNNLVDSVNTDNKSIDSSSIKKDPETLATTSQEEKKHTSVFLSKCSFDGFITPAFGYIYTAANTSIVSTEDSLNKFIQNRNQNTRTGSGITAGLRMNYALSKKIEVGIGFQYSSLSQSSYLTQKSLTSSHYIYQGYTMTDSIYDSIQRVYIHRQYFVKTDSSSVNSFTTQTKKFIDKYQNFSIPIFIAYGYSITDRLSILTRTSLLINYQLHSVTYLNETEDKIIGHQSKKNLSLGGSFSIGGYYAFSRSCSVFVEPVVSYYFSNLFDKQAPIKQTLLMFGLQTGLRLSF